MKTSELDYSLPPELIAQHPVTPREASRLLVVDRASGRLADRRFDQVTDLLAPGDCLVLNDTKVLPARFFGRRRTGARLEGLFLRAADAHLWEVLLKGRRKLQPGETFLLLPRSSDGPLTARVTGFLPEGRCLIEVDSDGGPEDLLDRIGHAPLPPYIRRDDPTVDGDIDDQDRRRYQTVYARHAGAVAAPTAGLHFSETLLQVIQERGIRLARLTLHVGIGTFRPVTTEELSDHPMHTERFEIPEAAARLVNETRKAGGRIVAVGTTSTRALESAARPGPAGWRLTPGHGDTDLFIQPGYTFRLVDGLITNFHLPKSTLLALVGAFAGMDLMWRAYQHAIDQRYRFYSYGDAMIVL